MAAIRTLPALEAKNILSADEVCELYKAVAFKCNEDKSLAQRGVLLKGLFKQALQPQRKTIKDLTLISLLQSFESFLPEKKETIKKIVEDLSNGAQQLKRIMSMEPSLLNQLQLIDADLEPAPSQTIPNPRLITIGTDINAMTEVVSNIAKRGGEHLDNKNYEEAIKEYEWAVKLALRNRLPTNMIASYKKSLALCLNNLAVTIDNDGKAIQLYEKALVIFNEIPEEMLTEKDKKNHLSYLINLYKTTIKLAKALEQENNPKKAAAIYKYAFSIYFKIPDNHKPPQEEYISDLISSLWNQAAVLLNEKKYSETISILKNILKILKTQHNKPTSLDLHYSPRYFQLMSNAVLKTLEEKYSLRELEHIRTFTKGLQETKGNSENLPKIDGDGYLGFLILAVNSFLTQEFPFDVQQFLSSALQKNRNWLRNFHNYLYMNNISYSIINYIFEFLYKIIQRFLATKDLNAIGLAYQLLTDLIIYGHQNDLHLHNKEKWIDLRIHTASAYLIELTKSKMNSKAVIVIDNELEFLNAILKTTQGLARSSNHNLSERSPHETKTIEPTSNLYKLRIAFVNQIKLHQQTIVDLFCAWFHLKNSILDYDKVIKESLKTFLPRIREMLSITPSKPLFTSPKKINHHSELNEIFNRINVAINSAEIISIEWLNRIQNLAFNRSLYVESEDVTYDKDYNRKIGQFLRKISKEIRNLEFDLCQFQNEILKKHLRPNEHYSLQAPQSQTSTHPYRP